MKLLRFLLDLAVKLDIISDYVLVEPERELTMREYNKSTHYIIK